MRGLTTIFRGGFIHPKSEWSIPLSSQASCPKPSCMRWPTRAHPRRCSMGVAGSQKRSVRVAVLIALVLSLASAVVTHAQVTGATVSGTITDPSGGVVAGATVTTTNTATAAVREVTSDSAGLYSVPNLNPGTYDLRVTATGFSTHVQSGLSLAVGHQQQLNIALKV